MIKVDSSLLPKWDVVPQPENSPVRANDYSVEEVALTYFTSLLYRGKDFALGTGLSLLQGAGLRCLKFRWLMSPLLRRLNLMRPHLEGNEEHLNKVIAVYDQLELASQAIKSFDLHKKARPDADFATLKESVFAELDDEKADELSAAARHLSCPSVHDNMLWETFFVTKSNELLIENTKKQDKILNEIFKPILKDVLPNWLPLNFRFIQIHILNFYRDLKKAPLREASLVSELTGLLYKGLSTKDEFTLPQSKEGVNVRGINEWKKYLYKEARVDKAAGFINNAFSVVASFISPLIEEFIHVDNDVKQELFEFADEHIKIALLKFLNNIAHHHIDDIRAKSNGKSSKALPGNIILLLSKLWDSHKEKLHQQISELNKLNLSESKRKSQYLKIFKGFSTDLLKLVKVNPLEDIDVLSDKAKKEFWEEDVQNDILPEFFADLYLSLTKWEAEREVNEQKLTSFSNYAVDSIKVVSRRIAEGAQNYFAQCPEACSDSIRNALKRKFESLKTVSGHAAASYFESKENISSFKSVMEVSLPLLGRDEQFLNNLEAAIQPLMAKITGELFTRIDKIEKKKGNNFFIDTSFKMFSLFTRHFDHINAVQKNAGEADPTKLSKNDLISGMQDYKLQESKSGNLDQKRKYFDAKIRVFKAKENFDLLNDSQVKIAYIYNKTKRWFSIGQEFLGSKAAEAIRKVEDAKKELELAQENLSKENSLLRATAMSEKLLALFKIRSAADLPLPENLDSVRKDLYELLKTVVVPTMLQTAVDNMTDKDMMNTVLTKFLQMVKVPVKELRQKDPEIENVRTVLEAISFNSAQFKEGSEVAMQILDASEGLTLEKGILKIITTNPNAKRILNEPFEKSCAKLPNVCNKWKELISDEALKTEVELQKFHETHKEGFDSECGRLIKHLLHMIPLRLLHHVNILNVSIIEDSAAVTVGKMVREALEPWTFKKIIDVSLASMAQSLVPMGKWDVDYANNIRHKANQHVFTKITPAQKSEHSRDFGLPLTREAKQDWEIKEVGEIYNREINVRGEMTEFLSYQFKGILKSWASTAWHSCLRIIYKVIQFLFGTRAPKLRDDLNKGVFLVAMVLKLMVEKILEKIGFILDVPFTFLLENLYVRYKADKIVEWTHMSHAHDELVWDMMETVIDQTFIEGEKV